MNKKIIQYINKLIIKIKIFLRFIHDAHVVVDVAVHVAQFSIQDKHFLSTVS